MALLLKGVPVAGKINERTAELVYSLKEKGVYPTLAIVRAGSRQDDIAYENSAVKRCEALGVNVRREVFPEDMKGRDFRRELKRINDDSGVHGILVFMPLPRQMDPRMMKRMISAEKDVDGCTLLSLAGVFTGDHTGFPPCTAEAVLKILDYYGIEVSGKKAVVLGRSLVIGRPVAMMLMERNATVTICHTKTVDTAHIASSADILVTCTGRMETIGKEYFAPGQIVIDVGTDWNEKKHKLCGDIIPEEADDIVYAYTPVPGGVGSVTTALLINHVAKAAALQDNGVNI